MEMVLIVVIGLLVIYKLGLFRPIVDLSEAATRESATYNDEHKLAVAKRYEEMDKQEIDVEKVKAVRAKLAELNL